MCLPTVCSCRSLCMIVHYHKVPLCIVVGIIDFLIAATTDAARWQSSLLIALPRSHHTTTVHKFDSFDIVASQQIWNCRRAHVIIDDGADELFSILVLLLLRCHNDHLRILRGKLASHSIPLLPQRYERRATAKTGILERYRSIG